jgi:hypothetical protein
MRMESVLVALAACSDGQTFAENPHIEIITPAEGSMVTGPIELGVQGLDLNTAENWFGYEDGLRVSGVTTTLPDNCVDCMFTVSWPNTGIANGSHLVRIVVNVHPDGGDIGFAIAAEVMLSYARP